MLKIKKTIVHKIFYFGFFFLVLKYGYQGYLSYSGYCFKEERYLTDNEKIEPVIKRIISRSETYPISEYIVKVDNGMKRIFPRSFVPEKYTHYASVSEFLQANPECCVVATSARNFGKGFLPRLTGDVSGFVQVDYWIEYQEESDDEVKKYKYEKDFVVGNCGRVWL